MQNCVKEHKTMLPVSRQNSHNIWFIVLQITQNVNSLSCEPISTFHSIFTPVINVGHVCSKQNDSNHNLFKSCHPEQVVLGLVVNYMLYSGHSRCRKWRIRPGPEPAPWGTPQGRWWCCRPPASHSVLLGRSATTRHHFRSPEGTGSSGTGRNDSSLPDVQNASGCSCPEWPAEWERWRVKNSIHGGIDQEEGKGEREWNWKPLEYRYLHRLKGRLQLVLQVFNQSQ